MNFSIPGVGDRTVPHSLQMPAEWGFYLPPLAGVLLAEMHKIHFRFLF